MSKPLESYKVFPFIAWTLVIGFALFTYALTVRVQTELDGIATGIERLEMKLNALDERAPAETEEM